MIIINKYAVIKGLPVDRQIGLRLPGSVISGHYFLCYHYSIY